ncbi:hypothetical protein HOS33_gp170 [Erwinia phage vB_EamM_Y3]|uniref:Uncharacterized protein n=1 Tax=Erwinia phage vB_EamM_Y3 TaxID=1983553 RepID=A0A2H4IBE1_9CAUD|nr:hypothetical protein HOS33_gp170 [Erwinia phage vB_EamM_Y3]ARW58810.1 hypothetical protein Y3_170 [Erwinia phage vB_EamM_Y3]QZE56033.1 hypothetical protein pEaSNUABM52_00175 [Erwinia phage pEp_SNUABM_52]
MNDLKVKKNVLVGDVSSLIHDVLYEINDAPRGRRRFIIVYKAVYGNELIIDSVAPIEHSYHFKQSYLRLADTVVGSMLEVSAKWCTFNDVSVGYMPPLEKLFNFTCPTESHSGGILVYRDDHGSFFALPNKTLSSPLLVTDRGE